MPTLSDLASLVRAPAALSVPGDVLAGAAAAERVGPSSAGLAAASVCLYWAGMAANDWADRELDAVERPERPIPSGRVRPGLALGIAAGLTAGGLGLAALFGGRRSLAVAVPLAGAVWAYDLYAKNTASGPAVMAACRGLDVLLGATSRDGSGGSASGASGSGAAGSGSRASGASGSRADGSASRAADRRALRRTLPAAAAVAAHTYTVTELSRREVSGASPALPATTLAATGALGAALIPTRAPAARAAAVGALTTEYLRRYGGAQAAAVADPAAGPVRAAVGAGINALPALQGALIARLGAPILGVAVAAVAPLARLLARRVSPT